ncbi:uncharacterized protein ColSpa_11929 [Colletotrichum spaethianum]|uniref:Uncharacterized protein n=1 Tax=Colletotrichum spaethianum TaxID=700344 RepID=A0AA37PGH2_9PEZI|nr:uncharacterized protein ColSpa_11929 [Colletotrichum spaethianum]GKT51748.1 hypothetical protein ColSpa_11929 [Colletotrichum spaethianum]
MLAYRRQICHKHIEPIADTSSSSSSTSPSRLAFTIIDSPRIILENLPLWNPNLTDKLFLELVGKFQKARKLEAANKFGSLRATKERHPNWLGRNTCFVVGDDVGGG